MAKKEYSLGSATPSGMIIENVLNREDNSLPFGLYNPQTEGKLTWMCNYGIGGDEVVSVYIMKVGAEKVEKDTKYLKDYDEAVYVRNELLRNGWQLLTLPDIKFTVSKDK